MVRREMQYWGWTGYLRHGVVPGVGIWCGTRRWGRERWVRKWWEGG